MVPSHSDHPAPSTEGQNSAADWDVVLQLSHDINNLLGAVAGYAEMLVEDLSPTASIAPDLRRIHDSAQRASALVATLMVHARQAKASQAKRG